MTEKGGKRNRIREKLLHKYRLVILNEATFEEKISFKLNRLNVFVFGATSMIVLIGITVLLISFTPLKEYIPGYSSSRLKNESAKLIYQTDSLLTALQYTNRYLKNIKIVLRGELENSTINSDSLLAQFKIDPSKVDLTPTIQDAALREEVLLEDKYNIFERDERKKNLMLFPPITGILSDNVALNMENGGVTIYAPTKTPVKAVANGVVVFSEWTVNSNHVIIIEHEGDLLSVYKQNGSLAKNKGAVVSSGEVIAYLGTSSPDTGAAHLYFEIWDNGKAVNPKNFIDFN